jgi:hypothetical protein
LASKNSEKMPRKSNNQAKSINQFEGDEIKGQSIISKNQRQYGEGQEVVKGPKTRSSKGNKNQSSSPVESLISVTGEPSCGQADSLLVSRPLKPRHKGCYNWSLTSI